MLFILYVKRHNLDKYLSDIKVYLGIEKNSSIYISTPVTKVVEGRTLIGVFL